MSSDATIDDGGDVATPAANAGANVGAKVGVDVGADAGADVGADVLVVEDLTVRFPTDDGLVQAVRGVSYRLREREILGIVGESGSGKSVTSLAVMGLLPRSARITG